ncbi:MAG TPA: hypothetical protein VMT85_11700, partial [Thermoanaerobaculia bacterium]|nr:hypothetical protein [Thermoanaerobaculia bacterium]
MPVQRRRHLDERFSAHPSARNERRPAHGRRSERQRGAPSRSRARASPLERRRRKRGLVPVDPEREEGSTLLPLFFLL